MAQAILSITVPAEDWERLARLTAAGLHKLPRYQVSALNKTLRWANTRVKEIIVSELGIKKSDLTRPGILRRKRAPLLRQYPAKFSEAVKAHAAVLVLEGKERIKLYRFRPRPETPRKARGRPRATTRAGRRAQAGRPRRIKPVSYEIVPGQRKELAKAFIATMKSGHTGIFKRVSQFSESAFKLRRKDSQIHAFVKRTRTGEVKGGAGKRERIVELYGPSTMKVAQDSAALRKLYEIDAANELQKQLASQVDRALKE